MARNHVSGAAEEVFAVLTGLKEQRATLDKEIDAYELVYQTMKSVRTDGTGNGSKPTRKHVDKGVAATILGYMKQNSGELNMEEFRMEFRNRLPERFLHGSGLFDVLRRLVTRGSIEKTGYGAWKLIGTGEPTHPNRLYASWVPAERYLEDVNPIWKDFNLDRIRGKKQKDALIEIGKFAGKDGLRLRDMAYLFSASGVCLSEPYIAQAAVATLLTRNKDFVKTAPGHYLWKGQE